MSSAIWLVKVNDQIYQADEETIKQWASYGNIQATDMVKKGNLNWIEANKVPILREIFAHANGYQPQPPQTMQPTMYQPTMYNGNYGNSSTPTSQATMYNGYYEGNLNYQPGYSQNGQNVYNGNWSNSTNNSSDFTDEVLFSGSIRTFTFMLSGALLIIPLIKFLIPGLTPLIALPLLLIGLIVVLIYEIKFLIAAFTENVLWGIAVLLIHPAGLIFTIMYWQLVKRIVIMQLLGFIAVIISAFGLYYRG